MLNLWLTHSSDVPLTEQLATQLRLAVLAGDLRMGQRLPSVRALARRHGLHHNTVSQAYRLLEASGLVMLRHGSGVYVRGPRPAAVPGAEARLRQLLAAAGALGQELGLAPADLHAQLDRVLQPRHVRRVWLMEPDDALRRILLAELTQAFAAAGATGDAFIEVHGAASPATAPPTCAEGGLVVALPAHADAVRTALPASDFQPLHLRSVSASLLAQLPATRPGLVAIASELPRFLQFGRTVLLAAGLAPEALLLRDAGRPGWSRGLRDAAVVVCDTVTAARLPPRCRPVVFPLLADACAAAVQARVLRDDTAARL